MDRNFYLLAWNDQSEECTFRQILSIISGMEERPSVVYNSRDFPMLQEVTEKSLLLKNIQKLKVNQRRVLLILKEDDSIWHGQTHFDYLSLIHSQFDLYKNQQKLNQVQIGEESFKISILWDSVLQNFGQTEFPLVGGKIFEMVEKWRLSYEQLNKSEKQGNSEGGILKIVEQFQQLKEDKKLNELHVKISSSLLRSVEENMIQDIVDLEGKVYNKD